jgi:uncharacterized membrane protein YfcA
MTRRRTARPSDGVHAVLAASARSRALRPFVAQSLQGRRRVTMSHEFLTYVLVGFVAQLIDGALGMAYGITATSLLLTTGLPPALASATVHTAECATTAVSALSHHAFGNVSRDLFRRLLLPGILGAVTGALLLSTLPGEALAPWVAGYLAIMGAVIVAKAPRAARVSRGSRRRGGRRRVGADRRQHADRSRRQCSFDRRQRHSR